MFYPDILSDKDLKKFLESQNVKLTKKETRKELINKARKLMEKNKKEFIKNYKNKGKRMYSCVSPSGNTQVVTEKNKRYHSKNICSKTSFYNGKKSGCSFGAIEGKTCVPCKFNNKGNMPKGCRGCPSNADVDVFYCT